MRDLFQVVFELKKKEIELARQQIQSKAVHEHQPVTLTIKTAGIESSSAAYTKPVNEPTASKHIGKEVNSALDFYVLKILKIQR